jgi:hypothetical protein
VDINNHEIGNENRVCCFNPSIIEKCECGGIIHNEFLDENSDCEYFLEKQCDKCGERY